MSRDLSPAAVAARLAWLRASYVPMTAGEARRRLTPPPRSEPFAAGVARRLAELHALCELTRHLHAGRRVEPGGG
jgi:hypothetical protein